MSGSLGPVAGEAGAAPRESEPSLGERTRLGCCWRRPRRRHCWNHQQRHLRECSPRGRAEPQPGRLCSPKPWEEWEIPREADAQWPDDAKKLHAAWWVARISRQQEIDNSIAAKADFEFLYDKPYENKKSVRVAGPFTVESLSPHRVLGVDEDDELIDTLSDPYSSLKTTLKAEINQEAWETLHSDTSRPFDKPKEGRIAVKVINHLGDEVMKVFRV